MQSLTKTFQGGLICFIMYCRERKEIGCKAYLTKEGLSEAQMGELRSPVCNVSVSKKNLKHIVEYHGEKVYFCCDGCKVSFESNPLQYAKE